MKQNQHNKVDCSASYALFQENFEKNPSLEEEQTPQNDETDVEEKDDQSVVLYTESELDSIVNERVKEAIEKERKENISTNKDILEKELCAKFKAVENSIFELNARIDHNIKLYSEKLSVFIFNMFNSIFPTLKGDCFDGFDIYSIVCEEITKLSNVSVKMNGENIKNLKEKKENDHIYFEIDEKMGEADFEIVWNNGNVRRCVDDIVKKISSNFNLSNPETFNGEA